MKKQPEKKVSGKKVKRDKNIPKPDDKNERPFDYGGIPTRDLKKNLGCG